MLCRRYKDDTGHLSELSRERVDDVPIERPRKLKELVLQRVIDEGDDAPGVLQDALGPQGVVIWDPYMNEYEEDHSYHEDERSESSDDLDTLSV